jgi:conjugal transfer ATP-binding protein TraC
MNSDFQFLLRQKPESLAEAKKKDLLVMEDHMEKILSSITTIGGKYSEIAVKTPDGMAVGLLLVDPAVGKLMSTRAEDVENIKALERQGKTKMEAIDIIVSAGA